MSVSSQSDTEQADLTRERGELASQPQFEHDELARIYIERGVEPALASQVAEQLMAKDALGAHARDELGISEHTTARPVQAALTSAGTVAVGAALPLSIVLLVSRAALLVAVAVSSLAFLGLLGALGAWVGGAPVGRATLRVTLWGALAMALTAAVGAIFGTVV